MEVLSSSDILFLKIALGSSIAYGAQSLISYASKKPVPPHSSAEQIFSNVTQTSWSVHEEY
jgi:hypothetical protein